MGNITAEFAMDIPAYKEYLESSGAGNNVLARERLKKAVFLAMNQALTIKQSEIMTMHYLENLSITEIALKLGLNKSTVSRHLKRAKQKMQTVLNYSLLTCSSAEID